ncbi:MAG: SpoVR family protein [Clostridiales bacterium]|jgi:stage V sporulation protein R|nr:SpoVR family protein [Eubacteriales bacterium]MDH7565806.1 SpoVR family protein [Clostridiales bacterium]
MSDYSLKDLEKWNRRIEELVHEAGLDCYDQEFEIVSYEDMIGYEAYTGMPSHYPHWSYGKSYDRIKTLHKYNLSGLPYEMVINSNPCIAYLMKDNTLLLQILTIAHVYGHNDFFKNNRLFRQGTRADCTVEMFKNHADRVREYIADPGIGYGRVERILNAAHAVRFQISRVPGEKRLSESEKKKALIEKGRKPVKADYPLLEPKKADEPPLPDIKKIPVEPEEDVLLFIAAYGRLEDWERDLLNIVREETEYFIPQIETKIMNEGWASYWHYNILNKLNLPQGLHLEFLKRHNQVIRPYEGQINPYYLGFKIFEDLKNRFEDNPGKILEVRRMERDDSFIRRYLTRELCEDLNLFEYVKRGNEYYVSEIADEEGWKKIRDTLALSAGMGAIPVIRVLEWVQKDNTLMLEHVYDGREIELNYAYETLKHIRDVWGGKVMLATFVDEKKKVILCDESNKISMVSG